MNQFVATPVRQPGTIAVKSPRVSVVIINHNYGDFIEQCIRSVAAQDYDNIECVIVDCASSDQSRAAIEATLERLNGGSFRLLCRDTNRGQVLNALDVLDEIKGVFVTFLDADDFLFPTFISTHVAAHLNDLNSAALSVSDQVQIDAAGEVLAGTCHWHQKWREFEPDTAWSHLARARSWNAELPLQMEPLRFRLHYVPAWWSSWLLDRWIWSATSGLMFRTSLIQALAPTMAEADEVRIQSIDSYYGRLAHSVGGTLVIDAAHGAHRRHGKNNFSNRAILGGQTPNAVRDQTERFRILRGIAQQVLASRHGDLVGMFGGELYYSIAWQLMSNEEFFEFAAQHELDRAVWERTIGAANMALPPSLVAAGSPTALTRSGRLRRRLRRSAQRIWQ
ncbi:glycosyltransferase family A protein [Bradyrhizobium sp. 199]|uniref:glycosyltransferase family 2 protein n=1 Tax=Bradyrhizobium sp. 199 TaxID=2782664 RepID=UPI001FF919B2|nr:glycosyltransferase family A protein [Bradyrhizobium sp. 199]MCK1358987.1 glycosyltransferase family 2 protein [Bradyrhizobium sp. 199]